MTSPQHNRALLLRLAPIVVLAATASWIEAQAPCVALPPPAGPTIEVVASQAGSLRSIVAGAASDTTILLHDGDYWMNGGDSSHRLVFSIPGVTLRSFSGNRGAVTLHGQYATNELISITASGVTIADLTLREAYDHPIHVSGLAGSPISGILIHNVRIVDPGQQAIKINPNDDGYVDDSTIECCAIELTDAGRDDIRDDCYTGGIDAHQAQGWLIRNNYIEGFWCPSGLSEHGIHLWRSCRDTIVEGNVILDCARGIGFGLRASGLAGERSYPDDPYPGVGYKGHIDGIIRNNFIAATATGLQASEYGFDTGIGLEQAYGAQVVHNTVVSSYDPASSSIEYRFDNTVAEIINNLVSNFIVDRDGTATLAGNLANVPATYVRDVTTADLHLSVSGEAAAVDAGVAVAAGLADTDHDGEPRDSQPDVGADEISDLLFQDGFESADTLRWSGAVP